MLHPTSIVHNETKQKRGYCTAADHLSYSGADEVHESFLLGHWVLAHMLQLSCIDPDSDVLQLTCVLGVYCLQA
jgi:hypothetical protein